RINNQFSLRASSAGKKFFFEPSEENISNFSIPVDHMLYQNTFGVIYKSSIISDSDKMVLSFDSGNRDQWDDWGLDNNAGSQKEFSKQHLKWESRFKQEGQHNLSIDVSAASGTNLDLLSGYRVGGMAGEYVVSGYFRNEFRVKDLIYMSTTQEILFAEDRKLRLFAEIASFHSLDLDYLASTPQSQTIGGLGFSFYYGIRALKGLPVIIAYGTGLNVHRDSRESQRQEISLILAGAF
ncbi:MAG: hypothetical protein GY786_22945, partial [Proteobacteria bacterium]|nr:hypothetical protein [Pseudomonadota bacterium]